MITDLLCGLIDVVGGLISVLLPTMELDPQVVTKINESMPTVIQFVGTSNMILPLPDMITILIIDLGIRIGKVVFFCTNFAINKIFKGISL